MPLSKIFGDSVFRATVAVPGTNEATIILPYSTTPTQKAYKYAVRGMVLNPGDFVYVIPVSGTYVLLGGAAGGGGGATLTAGDGISITNDVIRNTQGIEYIVGTQTAETAAWTGVSTDRTLKVGKIIAYYLPYSGNATAATLTLTMANGTSTGAIQIRRTATGSVTTQFSAGNVVVLIYDGTYWRVSAYYDSNTVPTGYCTTAAGTVGKSVTCNYGYRGDTNYFMCVFRYANTASNATLSISTYAPEPAPIYVNGERTSASNTFSAGVILFLYHNGAYYCYNDGRLPLLVNGVVTSVQDYVEAKVPTKVSDLQNDTGFITGLEILSYGHSTWSDFLAAYNAKKVVYCKASSNADPSSGSQTRLAFMAYVNDATNLTSVEFQYYRSISSHTDAQQGDQVFVYTLTSAGTWSVETRNTFTKIAAGTNMTSSYSNGTLTLNATGGGGGGIPTGGKTYDALVKNSDVSGDAIWSPLLYRGEDGGLCEVDEI